MWSGGPKIFSHGSLSSVPYFYFVFTYKLLRKNGKRAYLFLLFLFSFSENEKMKGWGEFA